MRSIFGIAALIIAAVFTSSAQNSGMLTKEDESKLYAQTKQINQFFRRFNGEENEKGDRYYETDREFRSLTLRKKYLPILFDQQNNNIPVELKRQFQAEVMEAQNPQYLDFHLHGWFTEVNAVFKYQGRPQSVILFMKLQPERLGYEWVIEHVEFAPFKAAFKKDTTANKKFIHPMSHELGFMNLRKAFADNKQPEAFTPHDYQPDYLTLFLWEMKTGNLVFETIKDVKFHFFQLNGWYFELSEFNRPGYNTGWLISNLVKVSPEEATLLKAYLYGKN